MIKALFTIFHIGFAHGYEIVYFDKTEENWFTFVN